MCIEEIRYIAPRGRRSEVCIRPCSPSPYCSPPLGVLLYWSALLASSYCAPSLHWFPFTGPFLTGSSYYPPPPPSQWPFLSGSPFTLHLLNQGARWMMSAARFLNQDAQKRAQVPSTPSMCFLCRHSIPRRTENFARASYAEADHTPVKIAHHRTCQSFNPCATRENYCLAFGKSGHSNNSPLKWTTCTKRNVWNRVELPSEALVRGR